MTATSLPTLPADFPAFLAHRVPGWLGDGFERDELLAALGAPGPGARPGGEAYVSPLMRRAFTCCKPAFTSSWRAFRTS